LLSHFLFVENWNGFGAAGWLPGNCRKGETMFLVKDIHWGSWSPDSGADLVVSEVLITPVYWPEISI
jgi:hypothetical protein